MNKHYYSVKTTIKSIALVAFVIATLAACFPAKPPLGTAEQAVAARDQYNAGLITLRELEQSFSAVVNRFTQLAIVDRIVSEPPTQNSLDIPKADIETSFGIHAETSPGKFSFTPGGVSIGIEYLNGIDVLLDKMTYHPDTRLRGYNLTVTSNNRGYTTPAAEVVTLNITEIRPDLSSFVPSLLNTGASTTGSYEYVPTGAPSALKYDIMRVQGEVEAVGLSMQAIRQIRFVEKTVGATGSWESIETIVYLKSELPGVWWGFSATQSYIDNDMSLNVHMLAKEQALATSGLASFQPFAAASRVVYKGVRVAHLEGGPYTCDMNIANDIGSGTSIDLNWLDQARDTIFPSLKFPCSRTVLSLPELL